MRKIKMILKGMVTIAEAIFALGILFVSGLCFELAFAEKMLGGFTVCALFVSGIICLIVYFSILFYFGEDRDYVDKKIEEDRNNKNKDVEKNDKL